MRGARATDEGDFDGFVGARWPTLVRTLVLIGCPAELAPEVASSGLRRCRTDWDRTVEGDDPDVVVHREILAAWQERLRGPWWAGLEPPLETAWPAPDLSALDRLTSPLRTGLVLRRYAGLDPSQAVAAAGRVAGGDLPAEPDATTLRTAAENVVVLTPGPGDLATERPPRWRRPVFLVPSVLAGLVLVLGATTWWAQWGSVEGDDRQPVVLSALDPQRSRNPAEVVWYADDVLHLANSTYVLPTLRDLAALGAGAVYGDVDGRVVHLADDGVRTLLGTKDPAAPLAASDQLGWVAWVDPGGPNPRLLVYDVGQADLIGELDLPQSRSGLQEAPDTRPVAIDQETVYVTTSDGTRGWRPTRDPDHLQLLEGPLLVDVSSANRLYQLDADRIRLDRPFFTDVHDVPGRGGQLSADGNYAATRDPADGSVLVYDVRTGVRLDVRPPEDLAVADVVLAPEGSITYLTVDPDGFARREGSDSHPLRGELVTCGLGDGDCEGLATFVLDSEAPLLAKAQSIGWAELARELGIVAPD
ncbi:hypothetical protein [Nocardioides sp.]|uniref:hypothetical protein n=1 Tax=Nocardioides sp. TaxID=35761 RepID=UPI001A1EEBCA|nr:hypothetical protein [Nocardioides sp.]MBJ7358004.1 hypothetical protein [Nocardioides sp.]